MSSTDLSRKPVVYVSVPASVANNFDKMTKITQTVLGKLGCTPCHSGRDIRFVFEDSFWVDEKLNVNQIAKSL